MSSLIARISAFLREELPTKRVPANMGSIVDRSKLISRFTPYTLIPFSSNTFTSQIGVGPEDLNVSFRVQLILFSALEMAWKTPYQGDNHRQLYEMICAMKDEGDTKAYSNTASIIQSSGCGKSRMVDEQADLVFTIAVNLRGANKSTRTTFHL